jgi:predicted transposase YbfD/YdcC
MGLVLGQVQTAEKSNEITAIPILLEALDIAGCIVPAVCDVLAARIRDLRSKDQGCKNVGGGWRGNERSE